MGDQSVQPIAFGTPRTARSAPTRRRSSKTTEGNQSSYDVIVDATTGKLLSRQNHGLQRDRQPDVARARALDAVQQHERVPVELPDHGRPRQLFCWTATAGCVTRRKRRTRRRRHTRSGVASKMPWDDQANVAGLNRRHDSTPGNNVDDARVWSGNHGGLRQRRRSSARRARRATTSPPSRTPGTRRSCNPNNVLTAVNPPGNDIEAVDGEPLRRPQRHARLGVLPRLRRGPLERAAVQQRRHDERPDADAGRPESRRRSATTA